MHWKPFPHPNYSSEIKYFLTYLIFENLWNNHRHVVLCTSLKSRKEREWLLLSFRCEICCQNCFFRQTIHLCNPKPFDFYFSLSIIKTYLLTLMLKPRPPVACLRSTTVLCFRKWEFLIGKRILWTLKQYSGVMRHELQCKSWALRRTYIYLGFTSTCANHIQLLYG